MPKQPYSHYSLFGEPWWLDGVCGAGGWHEARVESDGIVQARLPYVVRQRFGGTIIEMPPMTQTLGPWFLAYEGKYDSALALEKDLVAELVGALPRHAVFRQRFHPVVSNGLPWYWHGFDLGVRYSYAIDDLTDLQSVWDGMQSNIRGDIRKAESRYKLEVRSDVDPSWLVERVAPDRTRSQVLARVIETATQRSAGRVLFAVDREGRVHAALFMVWDERTAYYLVAAADPALKGSGAQSLLLWKAIEHAATVSRQFDFEGSMIESIERFFRGFGARQHPSLFVSRTVGRFTKFAFSARDAVRQAFGK